MKQVRSTLKTFAGTTALLLAMAAFAAPPAKAPPLPGDSVYQLPLQLTDQQARSFDWRTRRDKPQLVSMFYTSCQYLPPSASVTLQRSPFWLSVPASPCATRPPSFSNSAT